MNSLALLNPDRGSSIESLGLTPISVAYSLGLPIWALVPELKFDSRLSSTASKYVHKTSSAIIQYSLTTWLAVIKALRGLDFHSFGARILQNTHETQLIMVRKGIIRRERVRKPVTGVVVRRLRYNIFSAILLLHL